MACRAALSLALVASALLPLTGCSPAALDPVADADAPFPTTPPAPTTAPSPDALAPSLPSPPVARPHRTDLSGDGRADYAVGAPAANTATVYVSGAAPIALSRPSGRFGAALAYAGDLDHDGHADLAVGAPDDDAVWLFGGGAAGVDPTARAVLRGAAGSGFGATLCGAGDLDGDGLDDLVIGSVAGHRISLVRGVVGAMPGAVDDALDGPAQEGYAAVLVALGDGSGRVAVGVPGEGAVAIVTARGGRLHERERVIVSMGRVVDLGMAALDANGDGRADLALTGGGLGGIVWAYGDERGFAAPVPGPAGSGAGTVLASAGDLDGDGADELLMASGAGLWVLTGDRAGLTAPRPWALQRSGNTASLAVVRDRGPGGAVTVLRGVPFEDAVERLLVGRDPHAPSLVEPLLGVRGSGFGEALAR